ncbi:MAG: rhodanese-like domain-containing protein [Chloroflexi bacterium]|nr:rhodanese-like domain-containing protein [Chloroflexota bacterium]
MKRAGIILVILASMALVLSACGRTSPAPSYGVEVKVDGGSYRDITVAQLKSMLENKDFLLVNVHIPYEGEIAGTDLFVPFDKIEQNLSRLPGDKGAKLVLYCRSDRMSSIAAGTMVGLGFSDIWNLDGGMMEWERQGYQLTYKQQ